MNGKPSIVILGGGNGAFATAADLTLRGFDARVLEAPEFASTIQPVLELGGIELENPGVQGFGSGFAAVPVITTDPVCAMKNAQIVLYCVPAFGERRFTEMIAPFIKPDQLIVFFCGLFGGALEFAHTLRSRGVARLPMIAETEALIYGAMKSGPASVRLAGRKTGMAIAALPAKYTEQVIERLKPLYSDLTPASNVLETGLRNGNPVMHPPIVILNAGRIDPAKEQFHFYWEGVTPPVGHVVEAVDRERLRVAEALGLHIPTTQEKVLNWYANQGAKGSTLGEVMSTNPTYKSAMAPQTLNHRFMTEDVPFGLVPIEELGHGLNVPTPIVSSLITIACELMNTDFRSQGRNLQVLGLKGLSADQIKRLM